MLCHVRLHLFGSQRESMRVVPESLDFGAIVPGEAVSRTVTLSEVPTDRFSVERLDVGELPIRHRLAFYKKISGLRVYRIRCDLKPGPCTAGRYSGSLVVVTSSEQLPQVDIPVKYEVLSPVTAKPEFIFFGAVPVGTPVQERVELRACEGDDLTILVETVPDNLAVEVVDGDPPALIIRGNIDVVGPWEGPVVVKAQSESWEERLKIRCVGYGCRRSEF